MLIFLGGNNSVGIYYAVLSAVQLIDGKQPVFHNAQVIDYPDFENRYFTLDNIPDQSAAVHSAVISAKLADYKMNGVFCNNDSAYNAAAESLLQVYRDKISQHPVF